MATEVSVHEVTKTNYSQNYHSVKFFTSGTNGGQQLRTGRVLPPYKSKKLMTTVHLRIPKSLVANLTSI